jgi:hypothetical protein
MKNKVPYFLFLTFCFLFSGFGGTQCITIGPVTVYSCSSGGLMWVDSALDGVIVANLQVGNIGGTWFPTPTTFCGSDAPGHTITYVFGTGTQPNPGVTVASLSGNPNLRIYGPGDTITGFVSFPGGCSNTCMATNVSFSFSATNNTSGRQLWAFLLDGQTQCGSFAPAPGSTYMELAPGQSGTMDTPRYPVGCGGASGSASFQQILGYASMTTCGGSGGGNVIISPTGTIGPPLPPTTTTGGSGTGATGGSGTGAGSTGTVGTPGSGTTYSYTNPPPITYDPTNSPGGTNPATDGTLQNGLNAIYNAENINGANAASAASQLHADLLAQQVILQMGTNLAGQQLSMIGSGFSNSTNIMIGATNLLREGTNWLTAIFRVASNNLTMQTNGFNGVSNSVQLAAQMQTNAMFANIASNRVNTLVLSNMFYGLSNAWVVGNTNMTNGLSLLGVSISNSFAAVMGGLTNLGGGGTNAFTDNGITNAIVSEHHDITNALGQLVDTNGPGHGYLVNGTDLEAFTTNADAATAALGGSFDAAKGVGDSLNADAETLKGGLGTGTGAGSDFLVSFAGHTLNLDPDSIVPGACDFVYYLTELVVVIAFYLSCGKLYYVFMSDVSKLRTGVVPNLNSEIFGVGGNFLGAAVHPSICAAIITIWAGLLTAFVGKLPTPGMLSEAMVGANSVIGAGGGTAWHLIRRTIPVDLILALAASRMILQFTMGNLIIGAAGIMRFFIGG